MAKTIKAIIDEDGNIHLLEPIHLSTSKHALVTILEEEPVSVISDTALLSEQSLAEDWMKPEEDKDLVTPVVGGVILVPFPFSDLSASKLRPALILIEHIVCYLVEFFMLH